MGPFDQNYLYELLVVGPPLLLSLTVHEFAHARMALAFGDPTAKLMGRVTLNPLAHLDLMGTICLLLTRGFGWAKPVPVNPANLHPRRLGDIAVSLAGPVSNLCLAVIAGLLLRGLIRYGTGVSPQMYDILLTFLLVTMVANVSLCLFNLIPLFPLDGHHILRELLPPTHHAGFMNWQLRYGRTLLMGLILVPMALRHFSNLNVIDPLSLILRPAVNFATRLVVPF